MTPSLRSLSNPIRLGGVLGVLFLAGPGSLEGLSLLLVHAQGTPLAPLVSPQLHAVLQLGGFFMLVIWGFLTHALPGMLMADSRRTEAIRGPIVAFAVALMALWVGEAAHASTGILNVLWGAGMAANLWGTWILLGAVRTARRSWRERPHPLLVIPLVLFPVAWALLWAGGVGFDVGNAGVELMLLGVVAPIILAMSYRMFSAMMGMQLPRPRWFDAGMLLWSVAVIARVAGAWFPLLRVFSVGVLVVAGVLIAVALRIFERERVVMLDREARGQRQVMQVHAMVACALLVVSAVVQLLGATGVLPGNPFYWQDAGRHLFAIGFCLILVMGIMQRVFPNFLRGRASSVPWMYANLGLVGAGLCLRLTEPFLPETALVVRVAAWLLYLGVLGFSIHMLRGMFLPALEAPQMVVGIRVSRSTEVRVPS
ncbi:MAG: NnrS family protein [Myxococcota bacterium]